MTTTDDLGAEERFGDELVRVTVLSGDRRADLALPGSVPVAELLPEVLRHVGALDPQRVHAGYRLVVSDGRALSGESGLLAQNVYNGAFLTVHAKADDRPPRVYDDIVEAMSDAVEEDMTPWQPSTSRRTALAAAAVLLLVGAAALVLNPSLLTGAAAAVVGVLLVVGAIVLSHLREEDDAAITLGWTGAVYAAAAGFAFDGSGESTGRPVLFAGIGLAVLGLVAVLGLRRRRNMLYPAVLVGVVLAIAGAVVMVSDFSLGQVAAVTATVAVISASLIAPLVLGTTRSRTPQMYTHQDITAEPGEVDEQQVRTDAARGHELLQAVSVSVGVLLVLLAPFVVRLGVTGTLLMVCAALMVMLRTRQYRVGSEVGVGLTLGVTVLGVTALSAVLWHPSWRPAIAVTLASVGVILLLLTLAPSLPSVRRGRAGEMVELAALVAMLPLVVFAIGLVDAVSS